MAASSPPDSPLSSIVSDDGASTPYYGPPTDTILRVMDHLASTNPQDNSARPAKRRRISEPEISEDDYSPGPGGMSEDEFALFDSQPKLCRWEDCPAGKLMDNDALIQHVQTEHVGAKRAKYTCEWAMCLRKGMNHPSAYALKAHMRSHTKEKPFICQLPECDRSFTRSDALAKHMRTVHEPEPPRASLTNANPIDPATGQPKKGPKLRLTNNKSGLPATQAEKNPANAGLQPGDPDWDPSPPNDNIRYTPAHHPVTGQPGFLINYPPDISFSPYESEIPADRLMQLLRRQLHWAKTEGEELAKECEKLEEIRKEEWRKKEIVLEGLLEVELYRGKSKGLIGGEALQAMEKDLRGDLAWDRDVPWSRKSNGADSQGPMAIRAGGDDTRGDVDMMAVGALMGLSNAAGA